MKKLCAACLLFFTIFGCALAAEAGGYTQVYEPETSWPMAATVAWRADASAEAVAGEEVRPATAFVWLDAGLGVYGRDGEKISDSLADYIQATAGSMIPALYISDPETASALKAFLQEGSLLDCFVVASPENSGLVKDVADLLHVRGMLDFTALPEFDRSGAAEIAAAVNGCHGKVALLSAAAATPEAVRLLQSLCATVWVQAPTDTRSLVTLYTSGVNGVVVDDFAAAIRAEELFQDDAPSLLRLPLIIGHRGDPSTYVENTLSSARGAWEEGVDAVENDIQLSADGELFILHDDAPKRLLGIRDVPLAESLTLAELQAAPFLLDDPEVGVLQNNEVPASRSRTGALALDPEKDHVPTLREYIEAFQGTGLIHDVEIKSYNPGILPVYKALVDEYGAWDQFFTVTFNTVILDALYADFPEISIGALGIDGLSFVGGMSPFENYAQIEEREGTEAALERLSGLLDQWNAVYCPFLNYSEGVVRAARHRGITVWPWTYSDPGDFARGYLGAVNGMTVDYPWWATNMVVEIPGEDLRAASEEEIPRPLGVTRGGELKPLEGAELVRLEEMEDGGKTLMLWRCRMGLEIGGENRGDYYLYSNPFVVTWE